MWMPRASGIYGFRAAAPTPSVGATAAKADEAAESEVEQKGWHWVDWNVCAEDAVGGHPSADTIYRNVVHETGQQTNCIVLMHDSSSTHTTAEALPDIIRWYADNGYTFLTVAEALPLS